MKFDCYLVFYIILGLVMNWSLVGEQMSFDMRLSVRQYDDKVQQLTPSPFDVPGGGVWRKISRLC